jgi:hypothetical protein
MGQLELTIIHRRRRLYLKQAAKPSGWAFEEAEGFEVT